MKKISGEKNAVVLTMNDHALGVDFMFADHKVSLVHIVDEPTNLTEYLQLKGRSNRFNPKKNKAHCVIHTRESRSESFLSLIHI